MGRSKKMMLMMMVALATVLVSWTPAADAQAQPDMSCIQALIPCTSSLNTTGPPPASCCQPLRNAFQTQLPCLCAVFQNTQLAESANVNLTQAMELPGRCGIPGDPSMCGGGASPTASPVAGGPTTPGIGPEASGPSSSPGVASTPTATPGSNASSSVAWTASLSSFMLVLAALMFY